MRINRLQNNVKLHRLMKHALFSAASKRGSAVRWWLDWAESRVWLGSKWGGWFVTDDMLFMNQHNCLCHFLVWATHSDDTCTHYTDWKAGPFCHHWSLGWGSGGGLFGPGDRCWAWLACTVCPQSCWKGGVGKSWIAAEHRSGPGPLPQLALGLRDSRTDRWLGTGHTHIHFCFFSFLFFIQTHNTSYIWKLAVMHQNNFLTETPKLEVFSSFGN